MSAKDAKEFVDLIDKDPKLQNEVKKTRGILVDLAKGKGFTFTPVELHEVLRVRWGVEHPDDCFRALFSQNTPDP